MQNKHGAATDRIDEQIDKVSFILTDSSNIERVLSYPRCPNAKQNSHLSLANEGNWIFFLIFGPNRPFL